MNLPVATFTDEDPRFLQEQLITYLGNKRALLPFIQQGVAQVQARLGRTQLHCADLFAGSGVVSRLFKGFSSALHVNDLEAYSFVTQSCYLTNHSDVDARELESTVAWLEARIAQEAAPGLISRLYAPKDESQITPADRVFYTRRNALYLDTARRLIGELPLPQQRFFLAPLLTEASVHTNTSGLFKGFYKNARGIGQFGGAGRHALPRITAPIQLRCPIFSRFECDVHLYRQDANAFISQLPPLDLAYIDPPYNQHPYGSNYFMLNLLVEYQEPEALSPVSGIPKQWNRSAYNQRSLAKAALADLIARCPASHLLISYNSEGFIPQQAFEALLARHGKLDTLSIKYNTFRGSRNLRARPLHVTEFLYLLEKGL